MTDINPGPGVEDILDDADATRTRLDRAGDDWLRESEARAFAAERGLRQAVRDDVGTGREWARERAAAVRARIEDAPVRTTIYALGLGVLIGVLLRR